MWPLTTAMSTVGTAIMSALGGIILVTAVTGYCLLYDVLNWSTVRRHSHA
ncbi:YgaP-like transmembrane domain [Sulfobacillus thermotolerans]